MNDNFRKPQYVKRYEYTYYDLQTPLNSIVPNGATQLKTGYKFIVDNSSEANPIDWYNANLEVNFKLVTLADSTVGIEAADNNANKNCSTTNGQSFIKQIEVICNGQSVYNNLRANEAANILSKLKFTKSYADTVGKDQFFYLDTSRAAEGRAAQAAYNSGFATRKTLTDGGVINEFSLPLNLYSYFAAFKNNLQPNLKTTILLQFEDDNNIVLRSATAPASKVIITKLRLWVPKIIFNEAGLKAYLADYLKPKTWRYLKEKHEMKQTQSLSDAFVIATGVRRPRHVFIWAVTTAQYGNQAGNIFNFGLSTIGGEQSFARAQLEINNSNYYPQLEFSTATKSRLYRALMSYSSAYNDYLSGPLIDPDNFNKTFGVLYFDLRNQEEDLKDSVIALSFRHQMNGIPAAPYTLNALVLSESEIELYTAAGKLLIKT